MKRQQGGTPRDEAWLEDLFRRHHAAVRTYCMRRLGDAGDDVVSEVFAVAWRKRETVPDRPLSWLYAVAARELLHLQRSEGRRAGHEDRAAARRDERADPFTAVDDRLSAQAPINTAMNRLRVADAEILRLWAWEELSSAEIAVVLGISATTARVRLHRARLRLKAQLHAMDLHLHQEQRQSLAPTTSLATLEPLDPAMTDLRARIKDTDPAPQPHAYAEEQIRSMTRQILDGEQAHVVVNTAGRRPRSRALLAGAFGLAIVGGGVAVASLGPAEEVATRHLLAPPTIISGVGPQDVSLPEAPSGARYLTYELACFDGTSCGTPAGSVEGPDDGQVKIDRGALPTTAVIDDTNPQRLSPLGESSLQIEVNAGTHWRLYTVYTAQYDFDNGTLPDGQTLGIPGIDPADYLPAVTTDGRSGWVSYRDLTHDAEVELTPSGVRQDPLTVFDADGVTEIGVADINKTVG